MKDMAKLHERDIFFGTSLTVTRSDYDSVTGEGFVRRMREHGCKAFIYVEYNPVRPGTEDWVVTDAQRDEILAKMAAYRASQPGVYIGFPGDEKAFGGAVYRREEASFTSAPPATSRPAPSPRTRTAAS